MTNTTHCSRSCRYSRESGLDVLAAEHRVADDDVLVERGQPGVEAAQVRRARDDAVLLLKLEPGYPAGVEERAGAGAGTEAAAGAGAGAGAEAAAGTGPRGAGAALGGRGRGGGWEGGECG